MFFDIYSVIWHILQFIFDIVDICCRFCTYVNAKCKTIQRRLIGEDLTAEKLLIEQNRLRLTKIPVHLAVILGTELPDFRALSKIIFWSLSTGIQNISFYDHQGNKIFKQKHFIYTITIHWHLICCSRYSCVEQSQSVRLSVTMEKG